MGPNLYKMQVIHICKLNQDQDKLLMPPPKAGVINLSSPLPIGLGLKDTIQEYLTPAAAAFTDPSVTTGVFDGKIEKKFDVKTFAKLCGAESNEDEGEELDLTGIDDDEIDGYIMSPEEIDYKTKMWMKVNAEYLKEKAEKEERERKELEEAEKDGKDVKKRIVGQVKKPRGPKKASSSGNNATAIEAIEKIVQEKKISTKINYDVLRSLASPSSSSIYDSQGGGTEEDPNSPGIFGESPIRSPDFRTSMFSPTSPTKRQRRTSFSTFERRDLSLAGPGDSSMKRRLQSPGNSPLKKSRTLSSNLDTMKTDKSDGKDTSGIKDKVDTREVVVESGPVSVDSTTNYDNEDIDDEFEEDEDEDIPHMSAAELLSKHRGDQGGLEPSDSEEEYY